MAHSEVQTERLINLILFLVFIPVMGIGWWSFTELTYGDLMPTRERVAALNFVRLIVSSLAVAAGATGLVYFVCRCIYIEIKNYRYPPPSREL